MGHKRYLERRRIRVSRTKTLVHTSQRERPFIRKMATSPEKVGLAPAKPSVHFLSCDRCQARHIQSPTLEEFVKQCDKHLYDSATGLACLINRAEIQLVNQSSSLRTLRDGLARLELTNEERLRPNWDQYFMQLASLAAQRSNCMKRRVGCVLVREKRVISTGYNGTPRNLRNCNAGGCSFSFPEPAKVDTDSLRCSVQ